MPWFLGRKDHIVVAQVECDSGQLWQQLDTQKAATLDLSSIGPKKGHYGDHQERLDP